jgi:hypothetical protein
MSAAFIVYSYKEFNIPPIFMGILSSIVARLRTGRPELDSRQGIEIFLFAMAFRTTLGPTQPTIQWVPGVKRPGREADHAAPSSAMVKNACSYASTYPYVFITWYLVKPRGNLIFTYLWEFLC